MSEPATMLTFDLPGLPPSANRLWRCVNGRVLKAREYREWRKGAVLALMLQAKGRIVEGPFAVYIVVYGMTRRRDIDNVAKPTLDALAKAGVVSDDRWCDCLSIQRGDPKARRSVTINVWGIGASLLRRA